MSFPCVSPPSTPSSSRSSAKLHCVRSPLVPLLASFPDRGQSSAFNGGDDGESSRRGTAKAKVSYAEQDEDDEDDILEDDEPVAPKKLVQTKIKLVVDPARARPTGAKPLVTTRTGVAADSGTDEDEEDQLDSDSQAESEEQEEDASDDYDDQGAGGAKGGTR